MNVRPRSRIFSYGSYYMTTDSSKNAEETSSFEQVQPSTRYRPARSTTQLVGVITLGFLTVVLAGCANPASDCDRADSLLRSRSASSSSSTTVLMVGFVYAWDNGALNWQ